MNQKDAQTLLNYEDQRKPITDACVHCGSSRRDLRLNNYKGCRFCRQTDERHQEAVSSGMGSLSDKYCLPLGPAQTTIGLK